MGSPVGKASVCIGQDLLGFQGSSTHKVRGIRLSRGRVLLGSGNPAHPAYGAAGQSSGVCVYEGGADGFSAIEIMYEK